MGAYTCVGIVVGSGMRGSTVELRLGGLMVCLQYLCSTFTGPHPTDRPPTGSYHFGGLAAMTSSNPPRATSVTGVGAVSPVTAARAVADRLIAAIAVGDYSPGERLPAERELAA